MPSKKNIPVYVIAGGVGYDLDAVYDVGVDAIFTLPNRPMTLDTCMDEAADLLRFTAYNILKVVSRSIK